MYNILLLCVCIIIILLLYVSVCMYSILLLYVSVCMYNNYSIALCICVYVRVFSLGPFSVVLCHATSSAKLKIIGNWMPECVPIIPLYFFFWGELCMYDN